MAPETHRPGDRAAEPSIEDRFTHAIRYAREHAWHVSLGADGFIRIVTQTDTIVTDIADGQHPAETIATEIERLIAAVDDAPRILKFD
jgi:hypothetical protein